MSTESAINWDEEAAAQLQGELNAHTLSAFDASSRNPILKHLNEDTSWLLSLPYPSGMNPPFGRCRYNVLIDPWLRGGQIDLHPWFSTQWHATSSCVQTVAELNEVLQVAESSALELHPPKSYRTNAQYSGLHSFIDLVVCSHEFSDHMHEATLKEVNPAVPVLAAKKAASIIRTWGHFEIVLDIPTFQPGFDWRTASIPSLPPFLSIARMQPERFVHLHAALLITVGSLKDEDAKMIVYTPHGVEASHLEMLSTTNPPLQTLALVHGLNAVSLAGASLNLGLENGKKSQKILRAKYWIGTHDEVKRAEGIIAPWLRWITPLFETSGTGQVLRQSKTSEWMADDDFVRLGSGQSLVLE